jgi:O-antigen/teichoic acid export membrane protein
VTKAEITGAAAGQGPANAPSGTIPAGTESLRMRYGKAALWNVVAAGTTQGATFLTNILVANILGRDVFGQYSIILSTLLAIAGVAQLATGLTATRYVAELRARDRARAGRILGLCSIVSLLAGIVASAALAVGANWLASDAFNVPRIGPALTIAAGWVLFSVMNAYQVGALVGLESFRALALLGIVCGAVQLAAVVGLAWLWGLGGAIAGLVLASALRWWLHARAIGTEGAAVGIQVVRRGLAQERPIFYRFALPAAISGFSTLPAIWLANMFLVRQQDGLTEIALFAAANNLRILVLFLPNLLNGVTLPIISSLHGCGARQYRKVFTANILLMFGAAASAALIVSLTAEPLLHIFGKDFVDGVPVLTVLMVATLPEVLAIATYQVIQSREQMWSSLFFVSIPRDTVLVALAYLLVEEHGALGLGYAYLGAWCFALAAIIVLIIRAQAASRHDTRLEA